MVGGFTLFSLHMTMVWDLARGAGIPAPSGAIDWRGWGFPAPPQGRRPEDIGRQSR